MSTVIASTYEIIERIGAGGGGVVYLAKHLRLNKKVVLKADKRELSSKPEILRREVDALKSLSHSYIPQVYDFFTENDTVYTVIDYVEGESLDKPLKRGQKFSQAQVIAWACELLEALVYLHSPVHGEPPRGIVHSDIKPANIMLMPNGDIKLIDFNIALALGEENIVGLSAGYASPEHYGLDFSSDRYSPNNTDSSSKIGFSLARHLNGSTQTANNEKDEFSNNYQDDVTKTVSEETLTEIEETVTMSMQQPVMQNTRSKSLKRVVVPDARSDIYSLGATLYHLLSGNRPAKKATDVIPLSSREFSPQIVRIITKSMNPDPNMRYQTAEGMLYDFMHLRENDPRTIKQKRVLKIVSIAFCALLSTSVFVSFTGLKRMESEQKMLTFAEYSQSALNDGNPQLAVQYAMEALPEKNIFTSAYTPQAQKALADALGVYDLADGFKGHRVIELSSEPFKMCLSPNGKMGVAVYAFELALFDTETGNIKLTLPIINSALADVVFIDDDRFVYAGDEGITVYSITKNKKLWTGDMATHIAVSADKSTIVGVYRNEASAKLYDINGKNKKVIDFGGNKQRVIENDIFADPQDELLKLSNNGEYLAVSFENGGLRLFNTKNLNEDIVVYETSKNTHFEGGFNKNNFVFSCTNSEYSEVMAMDINTLAVNVSFQMNSKIGVQAGESGVYISNMGTVVKLNPVNGEQIEKAYTDAGIRSFRVNDDNTIVATNDGKYLLYDGYANLLSQFDGGEMECSMVDISGNVAVATGGNSPFVKILKKSVYDESLTLCKYNATFQHSEARVNEDKTRLMLFNYKGFQIFDINEKLICEVSIPESEKVYDQQYSEKSGNLAVIYKNAFKLYSGQDGSLLYEADNLKSVCYAKYGVSIFDGSKIKLIDLDSGEALQTVAASGGFGAYCGIAVTDELINGGKFIGSSKTDEGYVFSIFNNDVCSVYDEAGNKKFEAPAVDNSEAHFTENEIIISPMHGTAVVYSLKDGKKIAELEKEAYVTYVTELDNNIVVQYVTALGEKYGMLLDKKSYEPIAYLPSVCDIHNGELLFDYQTGVIRKTKVYTIEELIAAAINIQ